MLAVIKVAMAISPKSSGVRSFARIKIVTKLAILAKKVVIPTQKAAVNVFALSPILFNSLIFDK